MMSVRGRIAAMHNIVIVFGRDSGQVRERVVRDRVGSCSRERRASERELRSLRDISGDFLPVSQSDFTDPPRAHPSSAGVTGGLL